MNGVLFHCQIAKCTVQNVLTILHSEGKVPSVEGLSLATKDTDMPVSYVLALAH